MAHAQVPAYTPAWLYRFFAFIQRLPVPLWGLGLLVIIGVTLALHLDAWQQDLLPFGDFAIPLIAHGVWLTMVPALWIYMDNRAHFALTSFFKKQSKRKAGQENAMADFLSLPTGAATLVFLLGLFFGYQNFLHAVHLSLIQVQALPAFVLISFMIVTALLLLVVYRAIRQAVLMRRLYTEVKVDIFNPTSVYALSRYASQSGLAILLVLYTLVLLSGGPGQLLDPAVLLFQSVLIGSAAFLFFAPLTSINRRMREEKDRLLSELGQDLENMYARVHKAVLTEDYTRANEMRNHAATLKDGWDVVKKIPTWPWEPESVRNLLTPLLIPVIAYLVSRFFGSLLGL